MTRDRSYPLGMSDTLRLKRAARFVETLSRETTNVTPLLLPASEMEPATTPETVTWPIKITGLPPGGSPELSILFLGSIWVRDGDSWTEVSVLVRPIDDDIDQLQEGSQTLGMLIGEYTLAPYVGTLVFAAAATPFGCGLIYDATADKWIVDLDSIAGTGLAVDASGDCKKLTATGASVTLGCGLASKAGDIHVDLTDVVTDGITWNNTLCSLSWNPGCGMTVGVSPANGKAAIAVNFDTLAGNATDTALVVRGTVPVAMGDPCPSLSVDLDEDFFSTETLVTNAAISIVAGKIRLTQTKQQFKNHFNAAGLHIDRTVEGSPATSYTEVDICNLVACCLADPLLVECTRSATSGDIPLDIDFTATPSGGVPPYTYAWDFGDGDTSAAQNPSHTYTDAGSYSPSVVVTDACGTVQDCSPGGITVTSPPPPTPGENCASAALLAFNTTYEYTIGAGVTHWFKFTPLVNTTVYKITTTVTGAVAVTSTGYEGGGCGVDASTQKWTDTLDSTTCRQFTATGNDTLWIKFVNPTGGAADYTVKVEAGTC